ncbi:hypothetical protein Tco_1200663 [Tanacetum coccineum]
MIMRFNEIHKFSDGTLQHIDEALDYRVKEFKVEQDDPRGFEKPQNMVFGKGKMLTGARSFMFAIHETGIRDKENLSEPGKLCWWKDKRGRLQTAEENRMITSSRQSRGRKCDFNYEKSDKKCVLLDSSVGLLPFVLNLSRISSTLLRGWTGVMTRSHDPARAGGIYPWDSPLVRTEMELYLENHLHSTMVLVMKSRLFDTYTGNPIKEILLKMNLPDHRLVLTGSRKLEMEVYLVPVEVYSQPFPTLVHT